MERVQRMLLVLSNQQSLLRAAASGACCLRELQSYSLEKPFGTVLPTRDLFFIVRVFRSQQMTTNSTSLGKFDVALSFIAGFSLLIASTYVVLWHESNRNIWIVVGCSLAFIISLLLSRNRAYVLGVALLFTALRFVIAAIGTQSLKLGVIALLLLAAVLGVVRSRTVS
jgi:hypothetical protein